MKKIVSLIFIFSIMLFGNERLDFHKKNNTVEYLDVEFESDDEKFITIEKLSFKIEKVFYFFSTEFVFKYKPYKPFKPPATRTLFLNR
ncbi:hypothetical protein ThvES_00019900 [Thiovulum sp. ES]|nr:hypothetical protein ThvES_00019900 [Thiovulum sp. ES]